MLIINFGGGLGNQLYQYLFLCLMKRIYPDQIIKADISSYLLFDEHNGFDLPLYFKNKIDFISDEELRKLKPCTYLFKKLKIKKIIRNESKLNSIIFRGDRLIRKYFKKYPFYMTTDLQPSTYHCGVMNLNLEKVKEWFLCGNWQNWEYYSKYWGELEAEFVFDNKYNEVDLKLMKQISSDINSVSIHVRRGDFLKISRFNIVGMQYYHDAIKAVLSGSGKKINELNFYIFSDDGEYIEKAFNFLPNRIIVKTSNCGIDLELMSYCHHNIIANSTFSFWGALLNKHIPKIVVAPKYCYELNNMFYEFSVPPDWMKIDNRKKRE